MSKFLLSFVFGVVVCTLFASSASVAKAAKPKKNRLFTQMSIEKGWQQATQHKQPMLVMFTSDNCLYCKKMLAETYGHPAIERMLSSRTQTVLAHADDYPKLIKKLGIRGYPSSVLVSPKGDVLDFVEGFVPPKEFAKRVHPLLKSPARQARAESLPSK